MSMSQHNTEYCLVTGFSEEIDRSLLRQEFSKFGLIRKVFVPTTGQLAKIYFEDRASVNQAVKGLRHNLYSWRVSVQDDKAPPKFKSERSKNTSKMYGDEVDVENSRDRLYTVHGQYIETLSDGIGNVYVNLDDVRKSGFAVYAEQEFNFSMNQKRNIVLDDFYQYMLSKAIHYLNQNRELGKYVGEDQILSTIERCRKKLLGDTNAQGDRAITHNSQNNNLQVSVPNNRLPQDKSLGRRNQNPSGERSFVRNQHNDEERSYGRNQHNDGEKSYGRNQHNDGERSFARNQHNDEERSFVRNQHHHGEKSFDRSNFASGYNSFAEPQPVMRPPKNLPNNFTPTQTQRSTSSNRTRNERESRSDTFERNTRPPRQKSNQRSTNDNDEETWGSQPQEQKPRQGQQNSRSTNDNDEETWGSQSQEQKPRQGQQNSRDTSTSRNSQSGQNRQQNSGNNSNYKNSARNNLDTSDSSEKKQYFMKSLESVEEIAKVDLDIGKTYDVQIIQLEKDKENICWVQESESSKNIDDLLLEIFEEAPELEVVENVIRGQLALAEFEETWCRCRVTGTNPLNVHFIDYGNRADVNEVKVLPDKFKKIPALGCRLAVNKNSTTLKEDMKLVVKIKTKYQDDTYLVDIEQFTPVEENVPSKSVEELPEPVEQKSVEKSQQKKDTPKSETAKENLAQSVVKESPKVPDEQKPVERTPVEKPAEKTEDKKPAEKTEDKKPEVREKYFFNVPKAMTELKNGDKVMLLDLDGNRMAVKTRECAQKSKDLLEYIKSLDKSNLLLTEVKEGQLVLCSKDGLPNLCRAIVTKKDSPTLVTIRYLDYSGEETLSIKSLRNMDEHLATEPVTLIFTPEMEVMANIGENSLDFIATLFEKKEKSIVVLTEDNDFDLKLESGVLLTQKLLELEKSREENMPKLVPATKSVVTSTPKSKEDRPKPVEVATPAPKAESTQETVSFNDMDFVQPTVGETNSYICYTIKDMSEITLISLHEESISHMEKISDLEIKDEQPYDPEITEMCVIRYKTPEEDEPSWYRGVAIEKIKDEYSISMVDFGTSVLVKNIDIRKFPANLKDIPMLGIFCELINIPHTEEILNKIKELVPEGDTIEVTIKEANDLSYSIEMPEIYSKLKALKLF